MDVMPGAHPGRDELPEEFGSLGEFWAFWDSHSTADYEDLMEDVEAQVDLRASKTYVAVSRDIIAQIQELARRQGVPSQTLVSLWLQEKVAAAALSG